MWCRPLLIGIGLRTLDVSDAKAIVAECRDKLSGRWH